MSEIELEYQEAKLGLFDTLGILDLYTDGNHTPQLISGTDWVEIEHSPGVYMKNVTLYKPDSFVISQVHGTKGAYGEKHTVFDDLEVHCITGRMSINGLILRSHNVLHIPAATEYRYEYLEDTYLTLKFIPKNRDNFLAYGPIISTI